MNCKQEIKKILLFCLPGIGDTLIFTPGLPLIRNKFPDVNITVLTMFQGSKNILERNPYVDKVLCWEFLNKPKFDSFKFLLKLRKERFNVSIMAFPAYRKEYNFVSFIVGAKKRIAHRFKKGYFKELTFLNTDTINVDEGVHNVINNLNLLELLEIDWKNKVKEPESKLFLSEDDEKFSVNFLRKRIDSDKNLLIGIHPGTVHYRQAWLRRWPKEKFAQLANMLKEKFGAEIIIFEGPSEEGLGEEIAHLINSKATVVTGVSLKQTAAIIKKCNLFISNDSGLMHIAAAMKIPTVVIVGPTNPRWTSPWKTKYRLVKQNIPCSPCYTYTLPYLDCKKKNFTCIRDISVKEVFKKTEELIREEGFIKE